MNYNDLREKYPLFYYRGFELSIEAAPPPAGGRELCVRYHFEIKGLDTFAPVWRLPLPAGEAPPLEDATLRGLVFALGMVEAISYWKMACCPTLVVEAGTVSPPQAAFWKKLFYHGLGEFFYCNGIDVDFASFLTIESRPAESASPAPPQPPKVLQGCLVPVGGGKDSIVTLELLKPMMAQSACYMINRRPSSEKAAAMAGCPPGHTLVAGRTLDEKMLAYNKRGFLNGHTPFSALVAFSAVLCAVLWGKKYVVLSNESSANEPTVPGTDVNHQYSKSFDFERDFADYIARFHPGARAEYFSLLRPLSEMQIAALFARHAEYLPVFRSCNRGSKRDIWCGECAKCLFVYCILSPFVPAVKLDALFGGSLFAKANLLPIFYELIGETAQKPFECVGSVDEVNFALAHTLRAYEAAGTPLPFLLQKYKETPRHIHYMQKKNLYFIYYDKDNLLPAIFQPIVEAAVKELRETYDKA